uniref:U3 small nucleolar RNA-associated protein 13 C-terminal domain-containing protein n=1 Tax=Setaria digitata TaxID=48799 RepID=A0A915Q5K6_9BILA
MKNQLNSIGLFHSIEALYTGGAIQWSLDGRTLFSACGNYIKASNIVDAKLSYTIGTEEDPLRVSTFLLNEDCRFMVVAYTNGLLRNYRLPSLENRLEIMSPEIVRQWKSTHTAPILHMKFSEGDILLASGSADFVVKIWNLEERSCIGSLKGTSAVSVTEFLHKSRVMVGYADGSASLFCLESPKKLIFRWANHTSQIVKIIIRQLPEVIFVSRDQTLSVVNVESFEKLKVLPLYEPVEGAVLVSGLLFTVGEEGVLKCWNPENAKLLKTASIYRSRIDSILYNRVCKKFLLATSDFNVFWVDQESFKIERQFAGFNDEIFDICFSGAKLEYLIAATNSAELRLYDTNTWSCHLIPGLAGLVYFILIHKTPGHTDSVLSLSTALWDPKIFASSSKDNTFIIWSINFSDDEEVKVEKVALATGHTNDVTRVRFSNSSKHHFIVSVSNDTTIKLWPLKNFSGKTKNLKLESSATLVAHAKDITCLDISVNDRLCVTGSMDKTAKLWHIETDKMQFTIGGTLIGHRRGVWDARFSPSTQAVVTCSGDCMIRIFSLPNRDCIATLSGHPSAVLNGAIVNSGKQIISVDSGGLLKIWDITANECITTVEAHDEKIWALTIANDESRFITGSSDGRIRIWEDISEKKREEEERNRAEKARNDQILANLVQQNRYAEALAFSLTLSRPYSCLKIVQEMMELESNELHGAVEKLQSEELVVLLDFAAQWNTNSRTADVAQLVLYAVLHSFSPEELLKVPNFGSLIEAYIPYTTRRDMEGVFVEADIPIEVAEDEEMPELIETVHSDALPHLLQNEGTIPSAEEQFTVVRKKKKRDDVEMVSETPETNIAEQAHHKKRKRIANAEIRKVPVPPHRYTPLKEHWTKIVLPVAEDFVRAFVLGFDVDDALALIRLDHLFLESFEINDVKPLKGEHLSRAIGRIAGKDGRTKFTIENITKTRVVLADSKIHLLGAYNNIRIARSAISSLIMGSPPSKVYGNLRNLASRASERL